MKSFNQYKVNQKRKALKQQNKETDDFCHIRVNGEDYYAETRHPLIQSIIVALKISEELEKRPTMWSTQEAEASIIVKLLNAYYS